MAKYIVVRSNSTYYTGDRTGGGGEYPLLWTPHRKFAKRYVRRGWAEKIAAKWNAEVAEVNR